LGHEIDSCPVEMPTANVIDGLGGQIREHEPINGEFAGATALM
jgi:hypothetical protein